MREQIKVSYVKNAKSTETHDISVEEVLRAIREGGKDGRLKGKIEQIRNRFDLESQIFPNDLKKAKEPIAELKRALPSVLWSGTFTERKNSALLQHSGLLCADLDDLGDSLEDVHAALRQSPYLFALFTSPSGTGLKAVFRCPADASQHAGSFRAVAQHVRELTGVEVDQACKDEARMCFMSFDPEIYHNPGAKEIEPLPEPDRPARESNGVVDLNERQRIATELLGQIVWQSETSGLVACPGKHLHTQGNGARDCMAELDNVPTVHCFHNSCGGILEGVNHELRSRIGKAEYVSPDSVRQLVGVANSADADGAIELPEAPAPYISPPLTLLPETLQDYIRAAAESMNVDVAYILLPLLSSLGSATGNTRSILLKRNFSQPPVIWTAIIGRSGSRKSPALDAGCFAVISHERELTRQNKQATDLFEQDMAEWESKGRKERGAKPVQPVSQTCLMDNLTLEVLADKLQDNPRGVLVKRDELSEWFSSFDKYSNAKGSDVSQWLSLHTASFLGVDRRSDHRSYRLHHPRVCLTGGIQPEVLKRALTEDFFERGLPARLLFARPPETPDRWNENEVSEQQQDAVSELFQRLWFLLPDKDEHEHQRPVLLSLQPEAKAEFIRYYNECGAASAQSDDREGAAWNKLSGYAARLALIGQLAHNPEAETVTVEVMKAACDLARWFGNEAVRIYGSLAETREQREQRELVEFIKGRGGVVSLRDAYTYHRPLRNQKDEAERQLNALFKAGFGDWHEIKPDGRGRPVRKFRLSLTSASAEISNSRGEILNCADADTPKSVQNTALGKPVTSAENSQNGHGGSAHEGFPPLVSLAEMAAREGWFIDPDWSKRVLAEDAPETEGQTRQVEEVP